jgi:hypothetical protein
MFPDAFLAHHAAHFDFSKASKFAVLIFQPPGLIAGGLLGGLIGQTKATQFLGPLINTTGLTFQCDNAILPQYGINTVDQRVFGAPFSVAATPEDYIPLQLQFISAGDMWERKFFEDWMEYIMPKGSRRGTADQRVAEAAARYIDVDLATLRSAGSANYRDSYIGTIQVIAFHDTGIPSGRYTFEECYPVQVQAQPLNWGDDAINKVNVTFKYTTWSREKNIIKQVYDQFRNIGNEVIVGDIISEVAR